MSKKHDYYTIIKGFVETSKTMSLGDYDHNDRNAGQILSRPITISDALSPNAVFLIQISPRKIVVDGSDITKEMTDNELIALYNLGTVILDRREIEKREKTLTELQETSNE